MKPFHFIAILITVAFISCGGFAIKYMIDNALENARQDGMKTIITVRQETENDFLRGALRDTLEEIQQSQAMMKELAGYDDKSEVGITGTAFLDRMRGGAGTPLPPRRPAD